MSRPVVAVVGSGLTALLTARSLAADAEVVLAPLAQEPVGGLDADGPLELPLPVDGEAQELASQWCDRLGLAGPAAWWEPAGPVRVWSGTSLRRIPAGLGTGTPVSLPAVASSRVLGTAGLATLGLARWRPARRVPGDRSVADLVDARLGVEVRDRLVAPWVAAPIGGDAAELSAACELPQVWAARDRPLVSMRSGSEPSLGTGRGVLTVPSGWRALHERLLASLAQQVAAAPLLAIAADAHGPVLCFEGREQAVDALVLAVAAPDAVRLLGARFPGVVRELVGITHHHLTEVVLDHAASAVPAGADQGVVLVPPSQGRSAAWIDHWPGEKEAPEPGQVRSRVLLSSRVATQPDDPDATGRLVRQVDAELRRALGVRRPAGRTSLRTWSVPQRTVGHLARLDRLVHQLDQLPPGFHLGGSALRGVGPAARLHDAGRLAHEVRWQLANHPRRPDVAGPTIDTR